MRHLDRRIPPGGRGKLVLSLDTSAATSLAREHAWLWTNDPLQLKVFLRMTARVIPAIKVEPHDRFNMITSIGRPASQSLTLLPNLRGVKITGIHHDMGDRAQAKLTGPDLKGRYKLTLYTSARKTSYDRGYVWVMLTGAHVSKVAIEAFILVGERAKGPAPQGNKK